MAVAVESPEPRADAGREKDHADDKLDDDGADTPLEPDFGGRRTMSFGLGPEARRTCRCALFMSKAASRAPGMRRLRERASPDLSSKAGGETCTPHDGDHSIRPYRRVHSGCRESAPAQQRPDRVAQKMSRPPRDDGGKRACPTARHLRPGARATLTVSHPSPSRRSRQYTRRPPGTGPSHHAGPVIRIAWGRCRQNVSSSRRNVVGASR
jgi:hypothetical protein